MLLFVSALELIIEKNIIMNTLIIDAAKEEIFLMIIKSKNVYSTSYENSKINYEKLVIFINDFLNLKKLNITDISKIYVNQGPGSFAGIRNSISVVKAIYVAKKLIIIVLVLKILVMKITANMKIFPIYAINLRSKKI